MLSRFMAPTWCRLKGLHQVDSVDGRLSGFTNPMSMYMTNYEMKHATPKSTLNPLKALLSLL